MNIIQKENMVRNYRTHIIYIGASTALYGFALGWWRSWEMAAYVALKLPMVFIVSTMIVSGFSWMVGLLFGAGLRYVEVLKHVFAAMASASRIILALVPVVFFFIITGAPDTGTREELRFAHAILMSVHIMVFAVAGIIGNLELVASLRKRVPPSCRVGALVAVWLGVFALVGCQVGWMMRPLVGSPNIKVEFLREDALKGNFLESVFNQIIPHLINKGRVNK